MLCWSYSLCYLCHAASTLPAVLLLWLLNQPPRMHKPVCSVLWPYQLTVCMLSCCAVLLFCHCVCLQAAHEVQERQEEQQQVRLVVGSRNQTSQPYP